MRYLAESVLNVQVDVANRDAVVPFVTYAVDESQ